MEVRRGPDCPRTLHAAASTTPAYMEQKKSHWTARFGAPTSADATERQSAPTELTVAGGPRVRILLAPAESHQTCWSQQTR
jgi:hypothetical protein